jgi:hypothetical protein
VSGRRGENRVNSILRVGLSFIIRFHLDRITFLLRSGTVCAVYIRIPLVPAPPLPQREGLRCRVTRRLQRRPSRSV